MSLINDALRRARDAQNDSQPPVTAPSFLPVSPEPVPQPIVERQSWWPSLLVVLVIALACFSAWQVLRNQLAQRATLEAQARQLEPADRQPNEPAASEDQQAPGIALPEPAPAISTDVKPEQLVTEPPPQPVITYKLQAIFYTQSHPSAIINGKTLFVGDALGELKLTEITRESATLANSSLTNRLVLSQQ